MGSNSQVYPAAGSHIETAMSLAAGLRARLGMHATPVYDPVEPVHPRSNVIANEEHQAQLLGALNSISSIVGRTLGPYGANTLVRDELGEHFATKDGYTVLKRMTFLQEIATMALDHVRSVSRNVVSKVGDGSTSSVIMADSIYTSAINNFDELDRFPPNAISIAMDALADQLIQRIRAQARKIESAEDLAAVATIAANNDPWAGKLIAEAYAQGGDGASVAAVIGGDETVITRSPGYRLLRGMVNECFANTVGVDGAQRTTANHDESFVLIYNGLVDQNVFNTKIAALLNSAMSLGRSFVLVAREYTQDLINVVERFMKSSPGAKVLFLDHAGSTRRGVTRMGDLAAVLDCLVASPDDTLPTSVNDPSPMIGRCTSVRSTMSETVFVTGDASAAAMGRAKALRQQVQDVSSTNHNEGMAEEIEEINARIRELEGSEVIISIGGPTEQSKRAFQYLMEDAVLAVDAARRSGVVEGLGMTAQRAIAADRDSIVNEVVEAIAARSYLDLDRARQLTETIVKIVADAYQDATFRVLENARLDAAGIVRTMMEEGKSFDVLSGVYTDIDKATVINPADTDIEVLRGAMSIVGLFLTSNQTMLVRPAVGAGLD